MSTSLLNRIKSIDTNAHYDNACKAVLASKTILAYILKSIVEECQDLTIEEIKACIESEVSVGQTPVHPYEGEFIKGMNNESHIYGEGITSYDIHFSASFPSSEGITKIYFNVEAQNTTPVYPIEKRGIYYLGRIISSQYETDFKNSHYEQLKKSYSIWICLNPLKEKRNTIVRYEMKPEFIKGYYEIDKKDYDIVSLVVINLGKSDDDENEGILKLLEVLLSHTRNVDDKQTILEDEFKIELSQKEREDIEKMCNLSYAVEQKGIEIGKSEGIDIGKKEGIEIGRNEEKVKILTKQIKKVYKINLKDWLKGLNDQQLEKAEELILEKISLEEFIREIEQAK